MTNFTQLKPGLFGFVAGAIAISVLGFTWGGWMSSNSADHQAKVYASEQVTLSMIPVCLENSASDPDRLSKISDIKAAPTYKRQNVMMDAGWATLPGSDAPNRELAKACIVKLELDGT